MKRGFPRPKVFIEKTTSADNVTPNVSYGNKWDGRNYPVPYTAGEYISVFSEERGIECIQNKVCSVCGEYVEDELVGLAILNDEGSEPDYVRFAAEYGWITTEAGPFHFPCLNLAFTMCPHLAERDRFLPAVGLWSDIKPLMEEWYEE